MRDHKTLACLNVLPEAQRLICYVFETSICFSIRSEMNLSPLFFCCEVAELLSLLLVLPFLPLVAPQYLTSWKLITKPAEDYLFSLLSQWKKGGHGVR